MRAGDAGATPAVGTIIPDRGDLFMTLDIIVPHYREPWETCEKLFDSIGMQRGLSLNNIRVLVVNDGDCMLDRSLFEKYPYRIEYLAKEHGGVSAARNYGLDHSDADYVMFCDIDDCFLSLYGLHLIFSAMQEGFDLMVGNFIEETFDADGNISIVRHDRDMTFMHGKVYRRSFLVEHELRFDPAMTLHEDGYFNMLTFVTATREGKVKYVETPLYLWCWNDNSTVRRDKTDFVLRTYDDVILTRIGLCNELKRRGYDAEFKTSVCMTVLNSYYDFQKPAWHEAKNEKHLRKAEKAFKRFAKEFGPVFNDLTNGHIADVALKARETAYRHGMLMERETLTEFIRRIEGR